MVLEIHSRPDLEMDEVLQLHEWICGLPTWDWQSEDARDCLTHLMESRSMVVCFDPGEEELAMFFKLKWG